jgi:hypothetical protein
MLGNCCEPLALLSAERAPSATSMLGLRVSASRHPSCPSLAAQAIKCPRDRFSSMDASIRGLAGALIHVVAFGSFTGRPITAEVLAGRHPDVTPRARLARQVADGYRIAMWSAQSSPSSARRAATVPRACSSAPPKRKRACPVSFQWTRSVVCPAAPRQQSLACPAGQTRPPARTRSPGRWASRPARFCASVRFLCRPARKEVVPHGRRIRTGPGHTR